jgi:hypothetical protein
MIVRLGGPAAPDVAFDARKTGKIDANSRKLAAGIERLQRLVR